MKELPDTYKQIREFIERMLGEYSADETYEVEEARVIVNFWDTFVEFRLHGEEEAEEWQMCDGHPDSENWIPEDYQGGSFIMEQWEVAFWRTAFINK